MKNATPGPCSFGAPEDTPTLPPMRQARQAARSAYIARVVSEAPPIPDDVLDRLAVLLRPVSLGVAA